MPIAQWGGGGRGGSGSIRLSNASLAQSARRGGGTRVDELQFGFAGSAPASSDATFQGSKRIGVISNDQGAKAALRELLGAAAPRWKLDCYTSVPEALPALQVAPPEAVLLDCSPGNPCEIDSAYALLQACSGLPIALLTHHVCAEAVLLTLRSGV